LFVKLFQGIKKGGALQVSVPPMVLWSTIYGDATYSLELQVRHQKLLTMFVFISVAKVKIKILKSK